MNEIKQYIKKANVNNSLRSKPTKVIDLTKTAVDAVKRKYSYDPQTKVLTISNIIYQDYTVIKQHIQKVIKSDYYKEGWCMKFDVDDKKEVGTIIREILDILKNKEHYDNTEIYWNQYQGQSGYFVD